MVQRHLRGDLVGFDFQETLIAFLYIMASHRMLSQIMIFTQDL